MFTFRIFGLCVIYLSARLHLFFHATHPTPTMCCIKCSFKGVEIHSRDLQLPQVQCPLTSLKLGFILSLVSKKFPYFSANWSGFFFFFFPGQEFFKRIIIYIVSVFFWNNSLLIFLMYHIPQWRSTYCHSWKKHSLEYCLTYVIWNYGLLHYRAFPNKVLVWVESIDSRKHGQLGPGNAENIMSIISVISNIHFLIYIGGTQDMLPQDGIKIVLSSN